MYVTIYRRHSGGHPTSSMQAHAAHANAPHHVHTGDKATSRADRVGEQHQQKSAATDVWADCQ
jgi:hypothetical protein